MLKINKIDDSTIEIIRDAEDPVYLGSVYQAIFSKGAISLIPKGQGTRTYSDRIENVQINGQVYTDGKEAAKAANAFVGLGFKSGGATPSPTEDYERGYADGTSAIINSQSNGNITPSDVLKERIGYAAFNTEVIGSLDPKKITKHNIIFVDIDGRTISDKYYNTGENAIFPTPPTHEYLQFVGWTHTVEELSNLQPRPSERGEIVPGDEVVGAVYKTSDDKTHIFIDVNTNVQSARLVTINVGNPGTTPVINIDWGDGSAIETFTQVNLNALRSHNYLQDGEYHITIWSNENALYSLGNGSTATPVVASSKLGVRKAYFSDYAVLKSYSCYDFDNLNVVSLSNAAPILNNSFYGCHSLKALILPRINTICPADVCNGNYLSKWVVIPPTVTTLENTAFTLCTSIEKLVIPRGINALPDRFVLSGSTQYLVSDPITNIGLDGFSNCYLMQGINLAQTVLAPGTLSLNNVFNLKLKDLKVIATSNIVVNFTWVFQLTGTLEIDGSVPITASSLNTLQGVNKIVIGENITSIVGSVSPVNCMEYEFKSLTPPNLANAGYLAPNKLAVIYVPAESVDAYKTATNWTGLAGFIQPKI